ncbi:unnamed protein product [Ceratitis capitata]|uniref:(Mediterranean fruit fly) hypothetical protein n=1 Tax=Ceratitis capitata TaxID=7213 RepID=A0A811U199_CERCA|nr:unnamed protein product [Ceratitis capitata]
MALPQGRTVNKEYARNARICGRTKIGFCTKGRYRFSHIVACAGIFNDAAATVFPRYGPCDFFLFPKLKRLMKGRRHATIDEIKTASKEGGAEQNKKNDF